MTETLFDLDRHGQFPRSNRTERRTLTPALLPLSLFRAKGREVMLHFVSLYHSMPNLACFYYMNEQDKQDRFLYPVYPALCEYRTQITRS